MKKYILIFLFFFNIISFSQSFEQNALDFYAETILKNEKKKTVYYDGVIDNYKSEFQKIAKSTLENFYQCKLTSKGTNNKDTKIDFNEWKRINEKLKTYKFKSLDKLEIKKLNISKPIKTRKESKYVTPNKINYKIKKIWYSIFGRKYNLVIFPAIFFERKYYVLIKETKTDFELGSWYYIKINESKEIEDWCEINWIS